MLRIRDLAVAAPEGWPEAPGLDLDLARGETLLVTGPSGSGKSRFLKVLAGTEQPARGEVRVAGVLVWPGDGALALSGRVRLGFAFASGGLLSNLSLADNVSLPLRFGGVAKEEAGRRAEAALGRLGLLPVAHLRPHAVSSAARKHANLARLLALDPDLALLDEPLEGLDAADREAAFELIAGWAADPRRTLILAAEDAAPFAGLGARRLDLRPPSASSPETP